MKITIQKLLTAALSLLMITQLTACGKSNDGGKAAPAAEYVYRGKSAEINGEIKGDFEDFEFYNGKIYFLSELVTDEKTGASEYYLNCADTGGGNLNSVLLARGEGINLSSLSFSSDGKGYYAEMRKTDDGYTYSLKRIDENGSEQGSADITEAVAGNAPELYPSKVRVCGDAVYIADYSAVLAFKTDGTFLGSVTDLYDVISVMPDKNGKAYAYSWSGASYELSAIDISAGKLEKSTELPIDGYSSRGSAICGKDSGYDFFISDGTALYGWNIGGEKTELLNWTAAGISTMEVSDIFYSGDETFVCAGKSYPYGYPKISVLTKQLSGNADKTELILAGSEYGIDAFIENRVVKFNAQSDKYYITVKKYPYDNMDKLTLDIISGNVPDILISNSYMPVDTYISKGIFADMYELIDNDSELSRGDFLPNIMTACETDGKLYRFTDKFQVYTVIGKTSVFGESKGITADRLNEIASSYPAGTEILPASTKSDVLGFAMEISGREFIDFKNRTCSFDSDSFIKMLEYANTYLDDQDYESYFDDAFWNRFDTMYADESALLMLAYLSGYDDIYRFEHANFGEKVTAVGFPCESGTGTSFIIDSGFSISAKSKNKDGAWEFVRTLLLPEYQDGCDCFSVRKDSLEKKAKAAMKHDPNRANYATVIMGQMALAAGVSDIGEPKREDIDRVNEIIGSASGLMTYDTNVMNIIREEAATYFNGSKSAKDAAELIQKRVKLYLEEQA